MIPSRTATGALTVALVCGLVACAAPDGTIEPERWPLAVAAGIPSELTTSSGTIRLTPDCAFLDRQGPGSLLLVWRSGNVEWDAGQMLIRHKQRGGAIGEFRSGDHVLVGGSQGPVPDWSTWLSRFDWEVEPKAACESTQVWYVGMITNQ